MSDDDQTTGEQDRDRVVQVYVWREGQPVESRVGVLGEILSDADTGAVAVMVYKPFEDRVVVDFFIALGPEGPIASPFTLVVGAGGELAISSGDQSVVTYGPRGWLEWRPGKGARFEKG